MATSLDKELDKSLKDTSDKSLAMMFRGSVPLKTSCWEGYSRRPATSRLTSEFPGGIWLGFLGSRMLDVYDPWPRLLLLPKAIKWVRGWTEILIKGLAIYSAAVRKFSHRNKEPALWDKKIHTWICGIRGRGPLQIGIPFFQNLHTIFTLAVRIQTCCCYKLRRWRSGFPYSTD